MQFIFLYLFDGLKFKIKTNTLKAIKLEAKTIQTTKNKYTYFRKEIMSGIRLRVTPASD